MQDRRTRLISRVLGDSRKQASGNLSQTPAQGFCGFIIMELACSVQKEDGSELLFSPGALLSIEMHKDGGAEQAG